MPKYIRCGKWNKNYKYILLTAIFAFLTNIIFGYTFNDYLDEIKIFNFYVNNNNHIIINYFFRYLGLIIFSFALHQYKSISMNEYSEENPENEKNISLLFIPLILYNFQKKIYFSLIIG